MRDLILLFIHLIATIARLLGPGGLRSVLAESLLVKQQLLVLNRSRQRSPNLHSSDRLVAALCALLIRPTRLSSDHDPPVQIRAVASQSANPGIGRDQNRPLCSIVPSLCGTVETGRFAANTSITRCFGRLRISKTSCSISKPASTCIVRIRHGKGERLTQIR